jgi:hypothetical protein
MGWLQISGQFGGLAVSSSEHVLKIFFVTKQSANNEVHFLLCGCNFLSAHKGALRHCAECCDES